MPVKMLVTEFETGIVMDAKAKTWHLEAGELPYRYSDSLAELLVFATALLEENNGLEIAIWDEEGNYIQTINSNSL